MQPLFKIGPPKGIISNCFFSGIASHYDADRVAFLLGVTKIRERMKAKEAPATEGVKCVSVRAGKWDADVNGHGTHVAVAT
mmetsp:Transcript_43244/g.43834  ORF Transcript_43244/g.43834 Transcript_43244/m.43834 type:complete len:81 (+) Transcript_43244:226-468(+)